MFLVANVGFGKAENESSKVCQRVVVRQLDLVRTNIGAKGRVHTRLDEGLRVDNACGPAHLGAPREALHVACDVRRARVRATGRRHDSAARLRRRMNCSCFENE